MVLDKRIYAVVVWSQMDSVTKRKLLKHWRSIRTSLGWLVVIVIGLAVFWKYRAPEIKRYEESRCVGYGLTEECE